MAALIPSTNRTKKPFQFREKDVQAIVKTVTFHRAEYSGNPITFKKNEHDDIQSSISTPFSQDPTTHLGAFDQLPLELLWDVILRLDMRSVFRFRQVNRIARQNVDSLKEYHLVVTHGLGAYCALLRTRSTCQVSLLDFIDVLCTFGCTFCDRYGEFVSLLTWQRCCFYCIRNAPELQVRTLANIRHQMYPEKAQLSRLPTLKTLPGEYTREQRYGRLTYSKRRLNVTSLLQVMQSHKSPRLTHRTFRPERTHRDEAHNLMATCKLPYFDAHSGRGEHGICCIGCQVAPRKGLYRPSLNPSGPAWRMMRRVYSHKGFMEHFRWCGEAQLLWKTSNKGKRRPEGMPKDIGITCHCKDCD